ncbi:MAG: hypothetical protein R6W73_08745, partial [Candidatus Saliniplasma sp.]
VSPVMDAIGSAVEMVIDTAVDTMASVFGGNSDDVDSGFIDLITGSEDADAGELIIDYFGFEDDDSVSSGDLSVSNSESNPDALAVVLSIMNILPSINLAAYLGGTGSPLSAVIGVISASIGFLSSLYSYLMPIYLDTFGLGASVIGFLGVLEPIINPRETLLSNPYADAILLGWTGVCAGYSSYVAYDTYSEEGLI